MRDYSKLIGAAALALLIFAPTAGAESFWRIFKKKAKTEKADTTKTLSKWEKLFDKEEKSSKGMLSVHLKKGKIYFDVPDSLLGRTFIMGTTIRSISDNTFGVAGGKKDLSPFTFEKADSTLYLKKVDFSFRSEDSSIVKALSKAHTGAIIAKFPVKATSPDKRYSIDMTDWLLDDNKDFSPFGGMSSMMHRSYKINETYKKDLSYVVDTKAFDDNVSVTVSRTYNYSLTDGQGKTVAKNRALTAEMTTSILLLPEQVYHPRMADPRIGFFFLGRQQFGSFNSSTKPVYFAERWRLEPSDTLAYRRGEKVTPVKPIVYYIDNDFPEWWKPYIYDAVLQWNEVFENIGFKDAVQALPFPEDDPAFDPDNIRYSCIRYAPVAIQNAMGPSWVDPRSGEIINASVYVYHDVIKLLSTWMFVQTAQADPDVRAMDIPKEILGDALMYVIKHEVGHTLGLMHNMSASTCIPLEWLRDPAKTSEYGTTTSIMDYARFNYVAQPGDKERGVKLTPPRFGKYDYWAIRWGYTPVFDASSFEEEVRITTDWITDSLKVAPFYRYGKQQMNLAGSDPSCQTEDLSDDVFGATAYGISNLKYIMSHFMQWISDEDDPDYEYRLSIYSGIASQYLRYFGHVAANVGGLYKWEVVPGDGQKRYANVPRDRQLRALEMLMDMYSDVDWLAEPSAVGTLPLLGDLRYGVQSKMASTLFFLPFANGFVDGVVTKEVSTEELYDKLFDFVWKPKGKLSASDRALQKRYVLNMIQTGSFRLPEGVSAASFASEPFLESHTGMCLDDISGFEWEPRNTLQSFGIVTPGLIYAQLEKSLKLLRQCLPGADPVTKAHYSLLIQYIEYATATK